LFVVNSELRLLRTSDSNGTLSFTVPALGNALELASGQSIAVCSHGTSASYSNEAVSTNDGYPLVATYTAADGDVLLHEQFRAPINAFAVHRDLNLHFHGWYATKAEMSADLTDAFLKTQQSSNRGAALVRDCNNCDQSSSSSEVGLIVGLYVGLGVGLLLLFCFFTWLKKSGCCPCESALLPHCSRSAQSTDRMERRRHLEGSRRCTWRDRSEGQQPGHPQRGKLGVSRFCSSCGKVRLDMTAVFCGQCAERY
jgi:hypothetical protein